MDTRNEQEQFMQRGHPLRGPLTHGDLGVRYPGPRWVCFTSLPYGERNRVCLYQTVVTTFIANTTARAFRTELLKNVEDGRSCGMVGCTPCDSRT